MCILYSIMAQSNPNWEIIVMDEGDNENIIKTIKDERIKYYKTERVILTNDGRGSIGFIPKHEGAKYASGNYLCFLNEDGYIVPSFVEEMSKYTEDIIGCNEICQHHGYTVLEFLPKVGHCNSNYIIKPDIYNKNPFTKFIPDKLGTADGCCPQGCVKDKASYRRIDKFLMIYN